METKISPDFWADTFYPRLKPLLKSFILLILLSAIPWRSFSQDIHELDDPLARACLKIAEMPEPEQQAAIDRLVEKTAADKAHALEIRKMISKVVDGLSVFMISRDEEINKGVAELERRTGIIFYECPYLDDPIKENIFERLAYAEIEGESALSMKISAKFLAEPMDEEYRTKNYRISFELEAAEEIFADANTTKAAMIEKVNSYLNEGGIKTFQTFSEAQSAYKGALRKLFSDVSIWDCFFCSTAAYRRAAARFACHLRSLDTKQTVVAEKNGNLMVTSNLRIGDQYILIEKEFKPGVNILEYVEFLINWQVDYFDAHILEYKGTECCEKILGRIDEQGVNPPWGIAIFSDVLMGAPGTVYGWYTGDHWRTSDKLETWEQVLGVLDLIPGEALVKIGIVGLVSSSGVMLVKYGGKAVKVISSLDEFWGKIPSQFRQSVIDAFVSGTTKLKYADKDMILYRHISKDGNKISYWMTDKILSPQDAKKLLALPSSNEADWIAEIWIKKGTPYVEGEVASQLGNKGFGSYAVGGGKQQYFLDEIINDSEIIKLNKSIYINPIK
jgi:hypothetical protein